MSRWDQWIRDALSPTPLELDQVDPGADADLVKIAQDATAPLEEEIRALSWTPRPTLRPVIAPLVLTVVAMAALVLAVVRFGAVAPVPENPPLVPRIATPLDLVGAPRELGPSIDFRGIGSLTVDRVGDDGFEVTLAHGAVRFEVEPGGPQRHLVVHAGQTDVVVKGTVFEVFYVDGRTSVSVDRGRVEVRDPSWIGAVEAGGSWTAPQDELVAVVPVNNGQAVDIPTPAERPVATHGADEPAAEVAVVTDQDPARAFAKLLDRADDPEAYARDVRAEIDGFLTQHPASPFQEEVLALRLEIDARILPAWQVLADIDEFLAEHPQTPRRLSLLELRATTARANQDCEAALPTYRQLVSEAKGPLLARSEAWRGLCAHQLGQSAEARSALTHALDLSVPMPLRRDVEQALSGLGRTP